MFDEVPGTFLDFVFRSLGVSKDPEIIEIIEKIWETHRKIMVIIFMELFGNFMVIFCLNNIFKLLIGFFRSGLV